MSDRIPLGKHLENIYKARDWIVDQIGGPVPGTDLIEVLAGAMEGKFDDEGFDLESVQELVLTIVRQRRDANLDKTDKSS